MRRSDQLSRNIRTVNNDHEIFSSSDIARCQQIESEQFISIWEIHVSWTNPEANDVNDANEQ